MKTKIHTYFACPVCKKNYPVKGLVRADNGLKVCPECVSWGVDNGFLKDGKKEKEGCFLRDKTGKKK
jgi:transcription elongation factor Elf1